MTAVLDALRAAIRSEVRGEFTRRDAEARRIQREARVGSPAGHVVWPVPADIISLDGYPHFGPHEPGSVLPSSNPADWGPVCFGGEECEHTPDRVQLHPQARSLKIMAESDPRVLDFLRDGDDERDGHHETSSIRDGQAQHTPGPVARRVEATADPGTPLSAGVGKDFAGGAS